MKSMTVEGGGRVGQKVGENYATLPGAHHPEHPTAINSCNSVFASTCRFILR